MDNSSIKVLLIEDNPGDARLIQELLRGASMAQFDLERVERLGVGLQQLEQETVDVLLLDLGLPDSHGLDTFTKLHTQAPDVPILVLTGLDDQDLALEAVRNGAQDYLLKGRVDSSLLERAMRYAIERKRAEEALRRRNRELTLLNRVIAAATSTLEVEHLLQIACRELAQAFDLPQAAAALLDTEGADAIVVAEHLAHGHSLALGKTIPVTNNPVSTYVFEHKKPLAITDVHADKRLASVHELLRERGVVSLLIVPIVVPRGPVVGVLSLH